MANTLENLHEQEIEKIRLSTRGTKVTKLERKE